MRTEAFARWLVVSAAAVSTIVFSCAVFIGAQSVQPPLSDDGSYPARPYAAPARAPAPVPAATSPGMVRLGPADMQNTGLLRQVSTNMFKTYMAESEFTWLETKIATRKYNSVLEWTTPFIQSHINSMELGLQQETIAGKTRLVVNSAFDYNGHKTEFLRFRDGYDSVTAVRIDGKLEQGLDGKPLFFLTKDEEAFGEFVKWFEGRLGKPGQEKQQDEAALRSDKETEKSATASAQTRTSADSALAQAAPPSGAARSQPAAGSFGGAKSGQDAQAAGTGEGAAKPSAAAASSGSGIESASSASGSGSTMNSLKSAAAPAATGATPDAARASMDRPFTGGAAKPALQYGSAGSKLNGADTSAPGLLRADSVSGAPSLHGSEVGAPQLDKAGTRLALGMDNSYQADKSNGAPGGNYMGMADPDAPQALEDSAVNERGEEVPVPPGGVLGVQPDGTTTVQGPDSDIVKKLDSNMQVTGCTNKKTSENMAPGSGGC